MIMFVKRKTKKIIRVRDGFIPYYLISEGSRYLQDTWAAVDFEGRHWFDETNIKKHCTFRTIQEALIALRDKEEEKEVWNNLMGANSCVV